MCFEELTFEQKVSQSWLLVHTSLLAKGGSAPTGVTNLEPITVSVAAVQTVVSSLAQQSLFSATHLVCLLILTGVQCKYRMTCLNSGATHMYVVASVRTCAIEVVPDILPLWNSTAASKSRFLINSYSNKEFCTWSSTHCVTNRLAVSLFILLWLHLSWRCQMSHTAVTAWTRVIVGQKVHGFGN